MNTVTVGRIVHYFPNGAATQAAITATRLEKTFLAALVIDIDAGGRPTLSVFSSDGSYPLPEFSVREKSEAIDGQPYWAFPEIIIPQQQASGNTEAVQAPAAVVETKRVAPKKAATKKT